MKGGSEMDISLIAIFVVLIWAIELCICIIVELVKKFKEEFNDKERNLS